MDGSRGALAVARDDVAGLSTATATATETAAAAAAAVAPITVSTTIPAAAAAAEATTTVATRTGAGAGAGAGASATAAGARVGVAVIAKAPAPRGPLVSCLAGLHPRQPEQLQQLQQRRVTWQETIHVWGADPQAAPPRLPPLPSDDAAAAAGVPLAPPLPPVSIKSLREQLVDCYIVTQGLLRRNPSKLFVPWQDRRFQFHKHHLSYFRPEEATPRGTHLLFLKKKQTKKNPHN